MKVTIEVTRKRALVLAVVASMALIGGAAAYTMFNGHATVNVKEPFSITNVSASSGGSCTATSSSASCSFSASYPGAAGSITFTVDNAAAISETPIITATSNDTANVPVSVSHISAISGSSSEVVTLSWTIGASTPPEAVLVNWSVGR